VSVDHLRQILEDVRSGAMEVETALAMLRDLPYEGLGFAKLDHHRALRQGVPEVVFCQGKTTGTVGVKVARLSGKVVTASPEYEDCRRLALESGVPLKEVYAAAQAALRGQMNLPLDADKS
jgi:uncharacterized protein (DUF111 family)